MTWAILTFARLGAPRYLSHLDTARALHRTFARAGIDLALSRGMRPKSRLSLGLPLPVGAAGLRELAAVELGEGQETEPAELLRRLRTVSAEGLVPLAVEVSERRVRLDPVLAVYECRSGLALAEARAAAEAFAAAPSVLVERLTPKAARSVDLKRYVARVEVVTDDAAQTETRVRFAVRHRSDGAARPEEIVNALAGLAGVQAKPGARDLVRMSVEYDGWPQAAAGRESEQT